MPSQTPVYRIPYLLPTDTGRHIAEVSKRTADTLEATLQGRAMPISANITSMLARIDALERKAVNQLTGATGQNGYILSPSSRMYAIGDLVMFSAILDRSAGIAGGGVVVAKVPPHYAPAASLTFGGIASQGGSAMPTVLVLGSNGNINSWTNAAPNKNLAFQVFWKKK